MAEVIHRQVLSRPSSVLRVTGTFRSEPQTPFKETIPDSTSAKTVFKDADKASVARLQPSKRRTPGIEVQRVFAVVDLLLKKIELLGAIESGAVNAKTLPANVQQLLSEYQTQQAAYRHAVHAGDDAAAKACAPTVAAAARALFRAGLTDAGPLPALAVAEVLFRSL